MMQIGSAYQSESIRQALANRQRIIDCAEWKRQRTTWLWVLAAFAAGACGVLAAVVFCGGGVR